MLKDCLIMSELKRFWHYCFWFKDSHLYVLEFLEALSCFAAIHCCFLKEFSRLHCCLFVKDHLRLVPSRLEIRKRISLWNGGCPPTEKEGFEPSRRY